MCVVTDHANSTGHICIVKSTNARFADGDGQRITPTTYVQAVVLARNAKNATPKSGRLCKAVDDETVKPELSAQHL